MYSIEIIFLSYLQRDINKEILIVLPAVSMIVSRSQQTLIKADLFFSSPARKGHASYCYHLASVVCHPSKDIYTFDISIKNTGPTLTKLGQKVLGVSSLEIMCNRSVNLQLWLLFLEIEIHIFDISSETNGSILAIYDLPSNIAIVTRNLRVSENDCCLMPTQQFFSYIMARTS